ncbi:MAG: dihydroorotase [Candidatus Saelkia tenebricola]|nr:dihydroorotase [Candidatus Saelkia tenebricola]
MKLLIKNGNVADLKKKDFKIRDVLIEGEKIVQVAENIKDSKARVIDASCLYVLPGLIDLHAHIREPGREDEEDVFSASCAAVKGGFTTICCMPNTSPAIDNAGLVKYIFEKAQQLAMVDILPIGAITKNRAGLELSEMLKMWVAGAVGFSDDGNWVKNSLMMRRAMEYSLMHEMLLILHCEDEDLSKDGVINEGMVSLKMGLSGIPRESEVISVKRDIELAKLTGAKIHITHLSCKESVDAVNEAKKQGVNITADTAPHYLALTEEAVLDYNTNAKINPPLRLEEDRMSLIKALKDGVIDAIATDHAPHSDEEKDCEFNLASFGITGFETALAIGMKNFELIDLAEKMSYNPAKILGLHDKGEINPGFIADVLIVDSGMKWKLLEEEVVSKSKNTPFLNWEFKGKVKHLIHKGAVVMDNFEIKEVI